MANRTVVEEKQGQDVREDAFDANEDLKRPMHVRELNPQPSDDPKGLSSFPVRYNKWLTKFKRPS